MKITVARPPADNPADPVVAAILTGVEALAERGRQELDEQGFSRIVVQIQIPAIYPIVKPGMLLEVGSPFGRWRGKALSTSITADLGGASQTITLERVAE